jgi:N-acetylmuramoyl-L-alanine amidase
MNGIYFYQNANPFMIPKFTQPWIVIIAFSLILLALEAEISTLPLYARASDDTVAKNRYFEAETCYLKLKEDAKRIKFRHHWQPCIRRAESVSRYDPDGPWAPAGLFLTGNIYAHLYRYSQSSSDYKRAVDNYQSVLEKHPGSAYKKRAQKALARLDGKTKSSPRSAPKPIAKKRKTALAKPQKAANSNNQAKQLYLKADACETRLRSEERYTKMRENWKTCIDAFLRVYRYDRQGDWAAAGLYRAGRLYEDLFALSKNPIDWQAARSLYTQIINDHASSRYRQRASKRLAVIGKQSPAAVAETTPPKEAAEPSTSKRSSRGPVTITGLRHWSSPNYTRIVIDTDARTNFKHQMLRQDSAKGKPPRLYIDLANSHLGDEVQRKVTIDDDLLIDARAGQFTNDKVRVVADIKSYRTYKIFSLEDPFRIVIDLWGEGGTMASRPKPSSPQVPLPSPSGKIDPSALAKQLALGVRRVVIDAGHGGRDFGAPGYVKGVHEKQIVLQMAQRLQHKLSRQMGVEVVLTRNSDHYLTLEERTAIANTKNADLFISIHTNAARDRRAYGIETYFLNLATDDDAIRVAAMENATSTKSISDLHSILSELMQNAKINESARLAQYVQSSIVSNLKQRKYSYIKDKGVKQAPFYVLLGAQMPAILIETSFISNPRECKRLMDERYQNHVCDAIIRGIERYVRDISPSAFRLEPTGQPRG